MRVFYEIIKIAGLIVNLRAFNSWSFGYQNKKPFKDFETFFQGFAGGKK